MKVLLSCYRGHPFCGGQGIYIYYLSKELAKLGVEIDVIVGPPYPDPVDTWATVHKIENLNIWSVRTQHFSQHQLHRIFSLFNFIDYLLTRFHIFPEMETFSFRQFFLIKKLLSKNHYDIIHDVNSLGWGLIPTKAYGIPIISTIHHPLTQDCAADLARNRTFWEKLTTLLFYPLTMQRIVINRMNKVITSSQECVHELYRAYKVPRDKVSVVYNGMDTDTFVNAGQKREKRSLLFVGNSEDYKKGIQYLIEALTYLDNDITLTIVDDGPPVKINAWHWICHYNVRDRVTFTGKVDLPTLVNLYCTKTILVMSSLYEGFGLPAAEAMSCMTPVVATKAGALVEVVDDSCGILVEPRDANALARAVSSLIDDQERCKAMGISGRKKAETLFNWPIAAKNTLAVYQQVIASYRENQ